MTFSEFRKEQKKQYQRINAVFSPALGNYVYFRASGFHHLIYRTPTTRNPRRVREQDLKLNCLEYVPTVIANCTRVTQQRFGSNIVAYELVHSVAKDLRIRVIVNKVENGKYEFRSVMPHNRKSKWHLKRIKKHRS